MTNTLTARCIAEMNAIVRNPESLRSSKSFASSEVTWELVGHSVREWADRHVSVRQEDIYRQR